MRQVFLFLIFLTVFFLFPVSYPLTPHKVSAADFQTSFNIDYTFLENGDALISSNITLTNSQTGAYPSEYIFRIKDLVITDVKAVSQNQDLPLTISEKDNQKTIKVSLTNSKNIGLKQQYAFVLSYKIGGLAKKNGNLWEVVVPKIADSQNIDTVKLSLKIPNDFGSLKKSTLEPTAAIKDNSSVIYHYDLSKENGFDIPRLYFGSFALYSLELNYHLFNNNWQSAVQTIALPPNIPGFQEVFVQNLNPLPLKIEKDLDGNVLASYKLDYNEKKDVKFTGFAKVLMQETKGSQPNSYPQYLLPAKYWEVNDPKINEVLNQIFNSSDWSNLSNWQKIKDVYNFVVNNLAYNQAVETRNQRLGALQTLDNKDKAFCLEYTDLLITLLRSAGIPAKEIDGWANDSLHTWVEIYDDKKGWFMVDPTWESSSKQDYFDFLDFDHLALAVKGLDSEKPIPAGMYSTNDKKENDAIIKSVSQSDQSIQLDQWINNFQNKKEQTANFERYFALATGFFILTILAGLTIFVLSR